MPLNAQCDVQCLPSQLHQSPERGRRISMRFHSKYVAKKLNLDRGAAAIVAEMSTQMGRLPDGGDRGTEYQDGYQYTYYWETPEGAWKASSTVFCPY